MLLFYLYIIIFKKTKKVFYGVIDLQINLLYDIQIKHINHKF